MAKITPIDIVKGMSGKLCSHGDTYFSQNSSSGIIRTGKLCNPYQGEASAKQKAVQQTFKERAQKYKAWCNTNKPTTTSPKGTALYQEAQQIKKQMRLDNIRQVIALYMDKDGVIKLPSEGGSIQHNDFTVSDAPAVEKKNLAVMANPSQGGTVTGSGQYPVGTEVTITATPKTGYVFSKWNDDVNTPSRVVTIEQNDVYTAFFVAE